MNRKEIIIALAAGILIGWFAACGTVQCRMQGWKPEKKLERFSHELSLNSGQKEEVGAILAQTREKMMALKTQTRPQFEAIRAESNQKIRNVLTPEQQAKFDKLHTEWEKKREKKRLRWSD